MSFMISWHVIVKRLLCGNYVEFAINVVVLLIMIVHVGRMCRFTGAVRCMFYMIPCMDFFSGCLFTRVLCVCFTYYNERQWLLCQR